MLQNLIDIASDLPSPIVKESSLGDFQIPIALARQLETRLDLRALKIDKYTTSYKTSDANNPQWVVFPNQYFYFACHFYSLANELIKYIKVLDQLQKICSENGLLSTEILYGSWSTIKENIEKTPLLSLRFENTNELELFCRFIDKDDDSYRLRGKSFLNDNNGKGPVSIREPSGNFSSIILKRTNMPAVSAQGFGDLMWALVKDDSIYLDLKHFYDSSQQNKSILNPLHTPLPKPFLLLAGISGTGKTRFIREQASAHCNDDLYNYCLIPVRPDWHEPSDLLGYISRIGQNGTHYVVTDLLSFIIKSWKDAFESATETELICKDPIEMTPYWLCLDEMNLAPVEQYFADYLSILETREWHDGVYSCDALLKPAILNQLNKNGLNTLREELKLNDAQYEGLWAYFVKQGIPLPPNLIVAGTVNMDETTHGFSRKVIDRAFTIDFGIFYPNDFEKRFEPETQAITLTFPSLTQISKDDLSNIAADSDGLKSIKFLTELNLILKDTPFELAYRALNELLLAVVSFNPKDEVELQAVWDDFLMSKVLPRIDGDSDKLKANGDDSSLLTKLADKLKMSLSAIVEERPDLLRVYINKNDTLLVDCRSIKKLAWMQSRLKSNGFTTFWP